MFTLFTIIYFRNTFASSIISYKKSNILFQNILFENSTIKSNNNAFFCMQLTSELSYPVSAYYLIFENVSFVKMTWEGTATKSTKKLFFYFYANNTEVSIKNVVIKDFLLLNARISLFNILINELSIFLENIFVSNLKNYYTLSTNQNLVKNDKILYYLAIFDVSFNRKVFLRNLFLKGNKKNIDQNIKFLRY